MYGLIVWSSTFTSYVNKLSTLQNKAVKIVVGAKWRDRATPYFSKFNVLKLPDLLFLLSAFPFNQGSHSV